MRGAMTAFGLALMQNKAEGFNVGKILTSVGVGKALPLRGRKEAKVVN